MTPQEFEFAKQFLLVIVPPTAILAIVFWIRFWLDNRPVESHSRPYVNPALKREENKSLRVLAPK